MVKSFETCRTWDSFIRSTPSSTVNRLLLRPACFVAAQRLDCGLQQSSQTHVGPKLLGEADPELEESVPKGLASELGPSTSHAEAVELTPLIPEWPDVVELAPRMSEFRERVKLSSLIEEFARTAELVPLTLGVWAAVRTAPLSAEFRLLTLCDELLVTDASSAAAISPPARGFPAHGRFEP